MADSPIALPTEAETAQGLESASAPISMPTTAPAPSPEPSGQSFDVMSPEGKLGSVPKEYLAKALDSGFKVATPEDHHEFEMDKKYGGIGQGALAAAEGAARGASFGTSTGLETALGVPEEDIKGRQEQHPIASGVGEVGGLAASSFIPGVGEANLLHGAGEAGAAAVGLGKVGSGFLKQFGADAVKGAIEATLFQGGDEIHKAFLHDPSQTAETAAMHMGLAAVMGGVFGGAVGAGMRKLGMLGEGAAATAAPEFGAPTAADGALAQSAKDAPFISEMDRPGVDAGDLKATVESSGLFNPAEKEGVLADLSKEKPEAKSIRAAADRIGAPVMEGMVSDSRWIQKAEDALINGAPTYSGIKRQALYNEGYEKATAALSDALGDKSPYTKAELGNIMKSSITDQVKEENAPISAMYNAIKQYHDVIPLPEGAGDSIKEALMSIPEIRVAPSSPGGTLAKRVLADLPNLKTVDDLKIYNSELNRSVAPTASASEKRLAAIISDKLKDLEDASVEGFAKQMPVGDEARTFIEDLGRQRQVANGQYKDFITKVKTLSKQLGKGRIYGMKDATNFINDLSPEQITSRLFAKNNSEFLNFFKKEFPEQMELMRQYQKTALKETSLVDGQFSAKTMLNKLNKLEPEIQKSLFDPAELQKVKEVDTYLRSMPKSFNPSGTSHQSAMREFFHSPTGAAIANARDFGIEQFIKRAGTSPEVKNATALGKATVSGWNNVNKAAKAVITGDNAHTVLAVAPSVAARDKLSKLVDKYSADPQAMLNSGDNNPSPEYAAAFAATGARAMQYLSGIKPQTAPKSPLDSPSKPSTMAQASYNRALDLAQNPLMLMKHLKDGTLSSKDISTVKAVYPQLANRMVSQLSNEMISAHAKGQPIPYKLRQGLSLMMSQPLDSTMTPSSIMNIQGTFMAKNQGPAPQQPGKPPSASSTKGISKLPSSYQTPEQNRDARRQKSD